MTDSDHARSDTTIINDVLPVYDVSDAVATVVDADVPTVWAALMDVDLLEVGRQRPLVGVLGLLRALPDMVANLLHGELPHPPQQLRLRDTTTMPIGDGGWALLGERPDDEIALGLVGKFWRPVITFAPVRTADQFRDFTEPGYAKTVYSLSVRTLDDGRTLLSGTMRTATTDAHARRWFRRYWALGVGSGAHVLVQGVLDLTREMAEARSALAVPDTDDEPPLTLPTNRMFAVIDEPAAAERAVAELAQALPSGAVRVLCCDPGIHRLDATGMRGGALHRMLRRIQHISVEGAHVSRYEEEAREGHYVIEVVVEQPGQRELAVATLKAHGAHFINVYSRWTIEEIGR
jgi:hypothetical protein